MGVLEDQVVDLILDQASIEVIEADYDDVISGQAIMPEPEADEAVAENSETDSATEDESRDSDDTLSDKV
jgi:hypothetical protein